jgi:hypothetical protein
MILAVSDLLVSPGDFVFVQERTARVRIRKERKRSGWRITSYSTSKIRK